MTVQKVGIMSDKTIFLQASFENADYTQSDKPIVVGVCGQYKPVEKEKISVRYPEGRVGFRLYYVAMGHAHFRSGCRSMTVGPGHLVFCRPLKSQSMSLQRQDHPDVYMIELHGTLVDPILKALTLRDSFVSFVGMQTTFTLLFDKLIREASNADFVTGLLCSGIAMELLAEFGRGMSREPVVLADTELSIRQSVEEMTMNFAANDSVDEYARRCNMSVSYYIRQFKAFTGRSPQQFIIGMRMNRACQMLEDTSFRISEVAQHIGYENPLYFSRLFKKMTGESPVAYRRRAVMKSSAEEI